MRLFSSVLVVVDDDEIVFIVAAVVENKTKNHCVSPRNRRFFHCMNVITVVLLLLLLISPVCLCRVWVCVRFCIHIFFLFEISFLFSRSRLIWSRWVWWVLCVLCEWMFCVKRFKCKHNDKMKQFLFFGRFLSFLFHHSETKKNGFKMYINEENTTWTIGANNHTSKKIVVVVVSMDIVVWECAFNTSRYLYNCLCSVGGTGKQSSGANLHERVRWMRNLAHHFLFCPVAVCRTVADQFANTHFYLVNRFKCLYFLRAHIHAEHVCTFHIINFQPFDQKFQVIRVH